MTPRIIAVGALGAGFVVVSMGAALGHNGALHTLMGAFGALLAGIAGARYVR